jgi:hypothetical protein
VDEIGNLHKYFDCVNGAGSFIKQSKIDIGKSFLEALKERYVDLDAPEIVESDSTLPNAFVNTSKGNKKSIEFVGEKNIRKRQQISLVSKVSIRNDGISSIDPKGIDEIAAHLVEVDLQDNLLSEWTEIATLGRQLPDLSILMLHGNKFQKITESTIQAFPGYLSLPISLQLQL